LDKLFTAGAISWLDGGLFSTSSVLADQLAGWFHRMNRGHRFLFVGSDGDDRDFSASGNGFLSADTQQSKDVFVAAAQGLEEAHVQSPESEQKRHPDCLPKEDPKQPQHPSVEFTSPCTDSDDDYEEEDDRHKDGDGVKSMKLASAKSLSFCDDKDVFARESRSWSENDNVDCDDDESDYFGDHEGGEASTSDEAETRVDLTSTSFSSGDDDEEMRHFEEMFRERRHGAWRSPPVATAVPRRLDLPNTARCWEARARQQQRRRWQPQNLRGRRCDSLHRPTSVPATPAQHAGKAPSFHELWLDDAKEQCPKNDPTPPNSTSHPFRNLNWIISDPEGIDITDEELVLGLPRRHPNQETGSSSPASHPHHHPPALGVNSGRAPLVPLEAIFRPRPAG
jgi:hypothetical protein